MDRFGTTQGVRYGVLVSIFLAAAALGIQRRIRVSPTALPAAAINLRSFKDDASPYLRQLLVSDILVRLCERIPLDSA